MSLGVAGHQTSHVSVKVCTSGMVACETSCRRIAMTGRRRPRGAIRHESRFAVREPVQPAISTPPAPFDT